MKPAIGFTLLLAVGCGVGIHSEPEEFSSVRSGTDAGTGTGTGGGMVAPACAQAEGPLHPYTEKAELDQLLVGRWLHCSGPTLLENERVGVEFVGDGTYFGLALQGSTLVRLTGFGNQGTWDTEQETQTLVQFNWHPAPASGLGGFPQFEDRPTRLAIELPFSEETSLYVRAE